MFESDAKNADDREKDETSPESATPESRKKRLKERIHASGHTRRFSA